MTWRARIHGEITTSSKAINAVMELIGQQPTPASEGMFTIPHISHTITIELDDTYDELASHFTEDIYNLAQDYPEQTKGKFTITSINGFHLAQEYRVENGKMFRRTLTDAPEHEVFLHTLPARNGPIRELLVSNLEMEGIRSLQEEERRTRRAKTRQRRA